MTCIVEKRTMSTEDLRKLCIERNWYTCGNNEEYCALFEYVRTHDMTTENIVLVADNIKSHSDTEQEIESIASDLTRICNSFFYAPTGSACIDDIIRAGL